MARTVDLPIYKDAYELLIQITKLSQQFPRGYRQVMARNLCSAAQELLVLILKINATTNKSLLIEDLREQLQLLQLQIRVSKDLHLISAGQFGKLALLLDQLGRQSAGWLKFAKQNA